MYIWQETYSTGEYKSDLGEFRSTGKDKIMKDKIEIGEYVRTKRGKFGICISVSNVTGRYCQPKYLIQWSKAEAYYITKQTITKHSKNIIDLIEVGDIVEFIDVLNEEVIYIWDKEMLEAVKQDIEEGQTLKSILTREEFTNRKYKF